VSGIGLLKWILWVVATAFVVLLFVGVVKSNAHPIRAIPESLMVISAPDYRLSGGIALVLMLLRRILRRKPAIRPVVVSSPPAAKDDMSRA
jgi:hypothetical protein